MCATVCAIVCVNVCDNLCVNVCLRVWWVFRAVLECSQHKFIHAGVRVQTQLGEYGVTYGVACTQGFENKNGEYRTDLGPKGKCNHWMSQEHLAKTKFWQRACSEYMHLFFATQTLAQRFPRREVPGEARALGAIQRGTVPFRALDTCCSDETGFDPEYLAWL